MARLIKTVYLLEKNGSSVTLPSCEIERTASGKTIFRVRSTGRSLTKARQRAETEFRALAAFCKEQEQAR